LDTAVFLGLSRLQRGPRLWRELAATRWRGPASGGLGLGSLCGFLWGLGRGPGGVGSALRGTRPVVATPPGGVVHHETLSLPRFLGALLMVAGVVAIAWVAYG